MVIGSLNSRVSHFFTITANIVTKGLLGPQVGVVTSLGGETCLSI